MSVPAPPQSGSSPERDDPAEGDHVDGEQVDGDATVAVADPVDPPAAGLPVGDEPGAAEGASSVDDVWRARGFAALRWALAIGGAVVIYSAFLIARGADPVDALTAMWNTAFGSSTSFGETLVRTAPLLLVALAVVVPARAGLFNIGGEGQILLGAIGATGMAFSLGDSLPSAPTLVLVAIGGALAGMAWAAIPALLRLLTDTSEAISSLLLNYVAGFLLTWLVFSPWKDPSSLGQAYSERLDPAATLPVLWSRVHIGIVVALAAAVAVWLLLNRTAWGFRLSVVGGNPEAAKRAGFRVSALAVVAMLVGGALAGLAGMVEVTGVEGRLRPSMMAGFGYIGFLASWLSRHHPLKAVVASFALAAIAVGGFGLKISTGLSGAAVNVLMALVLLAVLGFAQRKEAT